MMPYTSLSTTFRPRRCSSKRRPSLRVHRLNRYWMRRLGKIAKYKEEEEEDMVDVGDVKVEMEIKNLKLYMENKMIMEENEKLRMKAFLLLQENQALLSQLQTACT